MREVVSRFDVDGIEMTFRDPGYFPFPEGRDRAHLMTDLVKGASEMAGEKTEAPIAPRGSRRIHFVSDPSSIAVGLLPDPVEADHLRRWVDMVADSGVDILQQDAYHKGCTIYWRSDRFQYDPRRQHRRFLPMLDAGTQPLQVLLDQSHERGMAFIAGLRMNDNHGRAHFPDRAEFVESHPEWWLPDTREAGPNRELWEGRMLDFTFDGVRDFVLEVVRELVSRFDVDGLEMTFREGAYFPSPEGRDRAHLMTDLVRRIRGLLDERSREDGRKTLGARVFSTIDECLDLGLDVPTWIAEGLIDCLSPEHPMYSDFNAGYAEFGALTRNSPCLLYPGLHPWISARRRRILNSTMTPSNFRALTHTFYGAGADGISIYNHYVGFVRFPPFYPQALQIFHELRDPEKVAAGQRHYVFDPTGEDWGRLIADLPGGELPEGEWKRMAWERDANSGSERWKTGAAPALRVVLDRMVSKPSGVYPFRLYERMESVRLATILLRGSLTERDEVDVQLNGVPMAPALLGTSDTSYLTNQPPDVRWYPVPPDAMACGENQLRITLTSGDPQASGEIVIDEVEIWVQPM